MKKQISRLFCVVLSVIMVLSCMTLFAQAKSIDTADCPTVIIPGLFQSEFKLYNSDGTDSGKKAPFFLDDTSSIVSTAVKKCGFKLLGTLITQSDNKGRFAEALSTAAADIVMGKIASDPNGKSLYDVRATKYTTSAANLSEHDYNYILNAVPLQRYVDEVGADKLYFLSYNSFGNLHEIANDLYELIQTAKHESGSDKVNVVPISQGGSIFNDLLAIHPEVKSDLHRVVFVVPAVDGSNTLGDIFLNGLNDDDDALYGYCWKKLMGESTGSIVNIAIRLFPKAVLNNVLDKVGDEVIGKIKYSTAIWGLIPASYYPACAEKYLSGEADKVIRAQTDEYYKTELNYKKQILDLRDSGVEVFDIVNYNHELYPIVDTWDKVNADGIIQLDGTSMGAFSAKCNEILPKGYTQKGNSYGTCSDKTHEHIDPHFMVDASTGLLPDQTFYFYNGDHEKTSQNDCLIGLVIRLLTDENLKSVYTYDYYPQFNTARIGRDIQRDIDKMKSFDFSKKDASAVTEYRAAEETMKAQLATTIVDADAFKAASDNFYKAYDKLTGENHFKSEKSNKFVLAVEKLINKTVGYRGFSDVLYGRK